MKLNEAALAALLTTREGPVGREVERRAAEIRDFARGRVGEIMHRYPDVVADVDYAIDESLTATIGIRDKGYIADFLATKANHPKEGTDSWLFSQLPKVFPG